VVERAAAQGVPALAIVDHDVVSGLAEAQAAGARLGVEVVAGIELTARWRGRTCHVLGYFFDPAEPRLLAALERARTRAAAAVDAGLELLRAQGHDLSHDDLARYRARYPTPTTLLLAMVRRRLVRTRADLTALLGALRGGTPPWTAAEAIALVHGAGGAAALAHPGRRGRRAPYDAGDLRELAGCGLDGVEVEHPAHRPEQRAEYAAMAAELGLVATGGSDCHGRERDAPPGSLGVNDARLAMLRARAGRWQETARATP
jgi:predicted metal-dependent phosphoesterase TrpH